MSSQIHNRRSIRLKGYDYSQAGLYFVTICCHDRECRFGEIIVGASLADALYKNGQPQGFAPTDAQMQLNEFGTVAYNEWAKLSERFPNFELDVFQIMPNHMHGIIALNDVRADVRANMRAGVRATLAVAPDNTAQNDTVRATLAVAHDDTPVRAGFTPAPIETDAPNDTIQNDTVQNIIGQPQGLPLPNAGDNTGATARVAPTTTVGDIVGAYKSLVTNACIEICNSQNIRLGKLWQRNFHEHIIRDEQSYQTISNYIINNPMKWKDDKFYSKK